MDTGEGVAARDEFFARLDAARKKKETQSLEDLCKKAQADYGDLPLSTIRGWFPRKDKERILPRYTKTTIDNLTLLLKVLDAGEFKDWESLLQRANQKTRPPEKSGSLDIAGLREEDLKGSDDGSGQVDEAHDEPVTGDGIQEAGATVPIREVAQTGSSDGVVPPPDTADVAPLTGRPELPSSELPATDGPDVMSADQPGPADGKPDQEQALPIPNEPLAGATPGSRNIPPVSAPGTNGRRRRSWLTTASAVAATVLAAVAGGIGATVWPEDSKSSPETAPSKTAAPFEALVDGTQVGVANPLGVVISVWARPALGSGTIGTVKHGQPVKVVCVTTGEKIRNGAPDPGNPAYHEDDRWVQLAPGQGINGIGYLSNTYFARKRLPSDLPHCPR